MTDIVEKLKDACVIDRYYGKSVTLTLDYDDYMEAADTITTLRAEVERLKVGLMDCMQEAANHHRENEARAKIGGSDMAQRKAKAIVARSGVLFHNIKAIARAALEGK